MQASLKQNNADITKESSALASIFSYPGIRISTSYEIGTTLKKRSIFPLLSSKAKSIISKINSFRFLENNWDSYGAEPVSETAIKNAVRFVSKVDDFSIYIYFTAPGRDGEVMIELRSVEDGSVEIFFNRDGSNEVMLFGENDEIISETTLEEDFNKIIDFIHGQRS